SPAANRPMMHGEDDGIPLAKRHDLRARLHARPLLGDDELTSREILPRLREQDRHLQREDTLSVEVLVQAVVVTRAVREQQRGRSGLAGLVAASEKLRMLARVPHGHTQSLVPAVGERRELWVEGGTQRGDERRQGVDEVLVLTAP